MNRIKEKLISFMQGRYGIDKLYYGLLVIAGILMLINAFAASPILYFLSWIILIIMLFRVFSRNIYKRQAENRKFMVLWNKIKSGSLVSGNRLKEITTHRYRKCPNCKAMLRLPRKTGKHIVNCPRCHKDFSVNVVV